MSIDYFSLADLPATPWKNGGGSTQEIACWPPGAGIDDFDWRTSVATIASDGPFSVFPGIVRHIMLLEGDGVMLRSADGEFEHALDTRHHPFVFSGDKTVHCTRRGGASSDFNLMTRRGQWDAELQVLDATGTVAPAPHGVLLALSGSWLLEPGGTALLEGEGAVWTDESAAWRVEARGAAPRLLAVRIFRATPTPAWRHQKATR
ncbi:MAG: HutD family protein [Gammaproteobacteria bacterium]|nr:HutD family protein [Gammaproteobacteria bacterium]MBU1440399.1 HutD family protein [Gammaproteobacteria bacterium]MBU2286282.1 HutD family protein [Gammaproteobacteria bacterium]